MRAMKGGAISSTRHEEVYHAAKARQAASLAYSLARSLSLTALRLRGRRRACQVESQKNAGFLAPPGRDQYDLLPLSRSASVLLLRLLEDGRLIALVMLPQSKDDPDPYIG